MHLKSGQRESDPFSLTQAFVLLRGSSVVHPAYVRTPMLKENLESEQWKKKATFLIEPETVADAIVKQLHAAESAQLVLPGRYWLATGLRGWPSWMQEGMRNSMKDELSWLGPEGKVREGRE